jgi:SUKH-3 immunity protein
MEFIKEVHQRFIEAGWKPQRNVLESYKAVYKFEEFPQFLKSFLKEYGDLTVLDCKPHKSDVVNELRLDVDYAADFDQEDYDYNVKLLGKPVYPFALAYPDGYRIACDADGKVYMLGDYTFLRADNFKEGIEKLLLDDWKGSLELNEKTGKWTADYKY